MSIVLMTLLNFAEAKVGAAPVVPKNCIVIRPRNLHLEHCTSHFGHCATHLEYCATHWGHCARHLGVTSKVLVNLLSLED